MRTKPGRRSVTESGSRDQRDIVAAIHGGPLPASAIKRSIALLEQRIVIQFERHKTQFAKAAARQKRVLAPLMKVIKDDRRAAEAAEAYAKTAPSKRPAKRRLPSDLPMVAPQVRGGSVLTITAPPYSVDWTSGSGSTSNSTTSGGGFGEKDNGAFGASTIVFTGGSAWGGGGVASQIQPIAENELMRFSAFVQYSYNWDDSSSWGDTAHSDGYLGVFITSFDLRGGDERVEIDQRSHMWSDGTGWWEEHSDSGEGLIWPNSQVEVFLPVTSSRIFLFWIWALQSGDAGSDSTEQANLDGVVPFMVFEQFT
jgi:hypothetical protein